MKHALLAGLAALGTFVGTDVAFAEETKTYAIIVANNGSVDEGVEPLRFADDDGARFYELFDGFVDDAYLLTTLDADSQRVFGPLARRTQAPTKANLRARIKAVSERIAADRASGIESEVYLVFTGHGNVEEGGEGYLSLADGKLRRSDLYRDVIRPLDASYTHLIIDACHAYFMVRSRGGNDWKDDRSGETLDEAFDAYLEGASDKPAAMSTVGVILSTAGAAEVHEWSKFRAGVFSHELRSGLLGAADADGNGEVSYRELEAYLVAANVAVTNPRARIKVFAEPPAQDKSRPLTRLDSFRDATRLVIPAGTGGRYHVEDSRGLRYADTHVDASSRSTLVLLRKPVGGGVYYLRTDDAQAEIRTDADEVLTTALAFAERRDQSRGSVEEAFRTNLFATPFGPSFVQGFSAGREALEAERAAPTREVSPWSTQVAVEYGISTPTLDVDGLQHNFAVSVDFIHQGTLGVGPYLQYGFSDSEVGTFHRASLGLEVMRLFGAGSWYFGPRARVGHQALFLDDSNTLSADPIGLRGEAALLGIRELAAGMQLSLLGGASIDVVTQTGANSGDERVLLNPFAGVGLRF